MFSLTTEIVHVNFIHVTMSTADLLLTVPLASVSAIVRHCSIQRKCQSTTLCLRVIDLFTLLLFSLFYSLCEKYSMLHLLKLFKRKLNNTFV